jgi:hypothetical protein
MFPTLARIALEALAVIAWMAVVIVPVALFATPH